MRGQGVGQAPGQNLGTLSFLPCIFRCSEEFCRLTQNPETLVEPSKHHDASVAERLEKVG